MSKRVGYLACLGFNYGTILQALALFQSIKKLGYDCEIIGAASYRNQGVPHPEILEQNPQKKYDFLQTRITFENFLSRYFQFNKRLNYIPARYILNPKKKRELRHFDAIVCGSDQIWKPGGFWFHPKFYMPFVLKEKRVAYAPSIGWNKIPADAVKNIPQWRQWILPFRYISVRESSGAELIKKITGRSAEVVLDPTFLLRPGDWNSLLPEGTVSDEIKKQFGSGKPYLLAYLLDSYNIYNKYIQKLAQLLKLEIIWLTGRNYYWAPLQRNRAHTDPAGFVQLVRNASFICADGYHGVCFALNFSRPFISLSLRRENDARVPDLLKRLGVEGRIIVPGTAPDKVLPPLDFAEIRKQIDARRESSLAYLENALEGACGVPWPGVWHESLNKFKGMATNVTKHLHAAPKPVHPERVPPGNPELCTGCGACMNLCRHKAISMLPDENGFLNPVVDDNKCRRCGRCLKHCPILRRPELPPRKKLSRAWAVRAARPEIFLHSSSGGMFTLLAQQIFARGGVVYGVAFDENLRARTVCAATEAQLHPLRGSKYVQADTGFGYQEIKEKLKQGIPVLFSGTSCQVAGLYACLGGDHELLTTVDLICSGTPSPLVFRKYLDWREKQFNSKITGVKFRSKIPHGWGSRMVLSFADGTVVQFPMSQDEYGILFQNHFIQRPACYNCKFRGIEGRCADLTIGDFWGIGKHDLKFSHDTRPGVSAVLACSAKGRDLFETVIADMHGVMAEERPLEEVYPGNVLLVRNFSMRSDYRQLYALLREKPFDEAFDAWFGDESVRLKVKMEKRRSGDKPSAAELLQLYASHIVYQSIYMLPPPVLTANVIQFPLSGDRRIHYELGIGKSGVRLSVHFEGPRRKYASCMSELLKQKLKVKLIDNRASRTGEVYCVIDECENCQQVAAAACTLIEETLPYLKVRLPQLTGDDYLNDKYTKKAVTAASEQTKKSPAPA